MLKKTEASTALASYVIQLTARAENTAHQTQTHLFPCFPPSLPVSVLLAASMAQCLRSVVLLASLHRVRGQPLHGVMHYIAKLPQLPKMAPLSLWLALLQWLPQTVARPSDHRAACHIH